MINSRYLTNYELRQTLEMKDRQIGNLKTQISAIKEENNKLTYWNSQWQKYRLNKALIRRSDALKQEIAHLSDVQTKLIKYLASIEREKEPRHVRGIAKELCLNVATASINLKRLQQKGLIRCYQRHSCKKKYYTLSLLKELIETV